MKKNIMIYTIPEDFILDIITKKSGEEVIRVNEKFLDIINKFTLPRAYCENKVYNIEGPFKDTILNETKLKLMDKNYDLEISKHNITKLNYMIEKLL